MALHGPTIVDLEINNCIVHGGFFNKYIHWSENSVDVTLKETPDLVTHRLEISVSLHEDLKVRL
jgi:hypothetical protein